MSVLAAFWIASNLGAMYAAETCVPSAAHIETFQSTILNRPQTIRIWLPPGYDEPANIGRQYPALFLFDGQEVLPPCIQDAWLPIDEALPGLIRSKKMPPLIVVGIDSGVRRSHEYLPYPSPFEEPEDVPTGKDIPDFLVKEVIPHVTNYRISNRPEERAIGGISNGAVAALYSLIEHPEIFGLGLLESPMLHNGNGRLVRDTAGLARGPYRVYIGIGTEEVSAEGKQFADHLRVSLTDANKGLVRLAEEVARNLSHASFNRPTVRLVRDTRAHHDPEYWRRRFPAAIVFLFKAPRLQR